MPHPKRENRGGRRTGTPGKAYSNRSDLRSTGTPLPAQAVTGQTYGKAQQQIDAQRVVPLRTPSGPPPGGTATPAAGAAPPVAPPGSLGPPTGPTARPGEPVTAGIAMGPGAGPEALGLAGANPDDEDLARLAPYLPTLELLAGQPNASMATRNFVRRIRGGVPSAQRGY